MSFFRFNAKMINGQTLNFRNIEGNVVLIVNTASESKFAKKQLKQLEHIYKDYKSEHFLVLGFPNDQIGGKEPKSNQEIYNAYVKDYGVSFPLFAKSHIKGQKTNPIFKWLKRQKKGLFGSEIKANFTKFLVNREGKVVKRYGPWKSFEKMRVDIAKLL